MALTTTWIDYGPDRAYRAYLCHPPLTQGPLPAVLVAQEIWGVDAHLQDVTRRLAAAGYVALAPDLYAVRGVRSEALSEARLAEAQAFANTLPPGILLDSARRAPALAERPAEARAPIEATLGAVAGVLGQGLVPFLPPLVAACEHVAHSDLTRGCKVGAVGFCLGGGLVALLACHAPLAATAIFYGTAPAEDMLGRVGGAVAGFYGALDERVTATVPAFEAAMKRLGKPLTTHVYANAQHAFFNDARPSYDPAASRDAFAKLLSLFNATLP
jgi:carboxymethylenebutenolidase